MFISVDIFGGVTALSEFWVINGVCWLTSSPKSIDSVVASVVKRKASSSRVEIIDPFGCEQFCTSLLRHCKCYYDYLDLF